MARPLYSVPLQPTSPRLRELEGREATLERLQKIQKNAVILSGNKQVAQAVASGRVAWGLTDTDDAIIEKDSGEPVAIVFPDQAPDQWGTLSEFRTQSQCLRMLLTQLLLHNSLIIWLGPETEERLAMGNSSQLPVHRG